MDQQIKIITVDWRKYGDFSAVGQLTRKIFSSQNDFSIYPVKCYENEPDCEIFRCSSNNVAFPLHGEAIRHDAAQNFIRMLRPDMIYVRLSPHRGVLEFATKLKVAFPEIPMLLHYMDKPSFKGMPTASAIYLSELYGFLVRRAESVYVIHESNREWIRSKFGRESKVLSNFIQKLPNRPMLCKDLECRAIKISYFGSIDSKMNSDSIILFCKIISKLPWVQFTIHSNSGVTSSIRNLANSSQNIILRESNLTEWEYDDSLRRSDLLLLPYNFDAESQQFLMHSFSNKFVDYLEVGGIILCIGSKQTPTVQCCFESELALVVENEEQLKKVFSSRTAFLRCLSALKLEKYVPQVETLMAAQLQRINDFHREIRSLAVSGLWNLQGSSRSWAYSEQNISQLSFLIRRRFFDQYAGGKQSLSVTLMSQLLKRKGYSGFDYEM